MKRLTIIALLLASASAFATNPPNNSNNGNHATADADASAVGIGVGIAGVKNDVTNTNVGINGQHQGQSLDNDVRNSNVNGQHQSNVGVNTSVNDLSNRNVNGQGQGQHQGQGQDQSQSASSDQSQTQSAASNQDQSQSANNEGNSQSTTINQSYKAVRNAPSFAIASVYPTAGCQAGVSLGGSGVNGGGGLAFSLTKKECEAVVLAQNFAAIGMPDTSCDILKTTKAFKRAAKQIPALKDVSCEPKAPPSEFKSSATVTPDLTPYVKRDELAERDRRIIEAVTRK